MGDNFVYIKEKITNILHKEETTLFLNNISKPLGNKTKRGMVLSKSESLNCFLDNIFVDDEIFLENNISNNCIKNILVKDERIIVRTTGSIKKEISFLAFGNNRDTNQILERVKLKKAETNYVLLIVIDRNMINEPFRICYNFYLKKMEDFSLVNNVGASNNWRIRSNCFNFFVHNLSSPIFTYSSSIV